MWHSFAGGVFKRKNFINLSQYEKSVFSLDLLLDDRFTLSFSLIQGVKHSKKYN